VYLIYLSTCQLWHKFQSFHLDACFSQSLLPSYNLSLLLYVRLRVLNATKNRLSSLPPLNENQDLNKVQELYLTCNALTDSAMGVISGYSRLKLLHIAHNDIEHLRDR